MFKTCNPLIIFTMISISISSVSCTGISGTVRTATPGAKAINQNTVHRNGCGIVSLINAYRFASPKWHKASAKIAGNTHNTDKDQFNFITKNYGRAGSRYTPGTRLWEERTGISSIDLKDLANDFQNQQNLRLPSLQLTTHYTQGNETHTALLRRTHSQLKRALRSGFPPIISIKHLSGSKIQGHIVILYEMPSSIPSNATSFPIKYVDPLGGMVKPGIIKVPASSFSSGKLKVSKARTLSMELPESDIAKKYPNTKDSIVLSASIAP